MSCAHLTGAGTAEPTVTDACPECVAVGNDDWVHLRCCVECGQVAFAGYTLDKFDYRFFTGAVVPSRQRIAFRAAERVTTES